MSTDQNAIAHSGPPRRFLRKGEGLKRFAAYKPPLPGTVKKLERRQTFVRFRLNQNNTIVRKEPAHFIPPEILNDDSINLSTEIPKIAPPKIIHTPVRPNRQALGTLTNETSMFTDSQINGNIDNLLKKIEEKKSSLEEEKHNDLYYNNKDQDDKHENEQQQQYDSYTPPESPILTKAPSRSRKVNQAFDLSSPSPGSCILALGKQIQQIESTVNELKEKIKNCECGAFAPPPPPTTRRRPTTRAAAKAAQSKASDTARPSADADNPTTRVINSLMNEVAELRAKFDKISTGH